MNALFTRDHGQPCFSILQGMLPPPESPQKGYVVIRVRAAAVSKEDLITVREGGKSKIPGREAAGIVEAVGEGTRFEVGDRVAAIVEGAWAELVSVKEDMVAKLPQHIGFAEGTVLLPATMLAVKAKEVGGGDGVVCGGGKGCVLVQLLGGGIVAVEGDQEEEMVKKMNVDRIVNRANENVEDVVKERVAVVYDFVGVAHRVGKIVQKGGKIISVGVELKERQRKKLEENCKKGAVQFVEVKLEDMLERIREMEGVMEKVRVAYGPCFGVREYVRALERVEEGVGEGKVVLLM